MKCNEKMQRFSYIRRSQATKIANVAMNSCINAFAALENVFSACRRIGNMLKKEARNIMIILHLQYQGSLLSEKGRKVRRRLS
jgi:hypothetical protein